MTTNQTTHLRSEIWRGLILACLLLGASVATKRLSPVYLSPEIARRLLGVLMGAVVVVYANAVPKVLTPLIKARCNPISEQAIRRFTGWSLVFGGAAYAAAWAIAPFRSADVFAASFLGASLLLVVARVAWSIRSKPR
jgi:hypothetical protein